jgi:hypothetical protein
MCKIDEVVAVGIEQDTVVIGPLVTVGQGILVKLPTLHASRLLLGSEGILVANIGMFEGKCKGRRNEIELFAGQLRDG